MKRIILVLAGLIPFPIGYYLDYLINTSYFDKTLSFTLIGIIFLFAWFLLGIFLYSITKNVKETVILTNAPALIALIFVLLGRYIPISLFIIGQLYFMPIGNISSKLIPSFMTVRISMVDVLSFSLMCIAFYLGCKLRED